MNDTYDVLTRKALMEGPPEALFCCIGNPVVGNPTQLMMEATFKSLMFPATYITCTVESNQVQSAIMGLKALGFSGANVTAPYKVEVMQYLDALTESAELGGAVNCIVMQNGRMIGDNTDGKGFLTAIEKHRPVEGMKVLVLGAGGAARAIITELALHGANHITIANRSLSKAQTIVEHIRAHVRTTLEAIELQTPHHIGSEYDLVVQATSVGLFAPNEGLDLVWQPVAGRAQLAADVVFNPIDTLFLKQAAQAGAITVDGLGMLVYQGAIAIEQWTGKTADCNAMHEALVQAFSS